MKRAFLSYARRNVVLKDRVLFALDQLKNERLIYIWHDFQAGPGRFDEQIKREIDRSDIFIPLLTPAFFRSSYCGRELDRAVRRKCQIIPVLLQRVPKWTQIPVGSNGTLLREFNALPIGGGPIEDAADPESGYQKIARDFRELLSRKKSKRMRTNTVLNQFCPMVFEALYWCLETDSWMHFYDEDPEADPNLPGWLKVKRSLDQIILEGTNDSGRRRETEARVDWKQNLNQFIYRRTFPGSSRVVYSFTLQREPEGFYFKGTTFDKGVRLAPLECAPHEMITFIREAFRDQQRQVRDER